MLESIRYVIKKFEIKKIPGYITSFPWYLHRYRFMKLTTSYKNTWNTTYAVVGAEDINYLFSLNDYTIPGDIYLSKKTYAEDEIEFYFKMVEQHYGISVFDNGKLFLDVGANIGTTSIYVSKRFLNNTPIIAFEPGSENFTILSANIVLNKCENIKTEKCALSNYHETKKFLSDLESAASSRILQSNQNDIQETERYKIENVLTTTIDKYLCDHQISPDHIGYLWIDVEGYEPFVIDGAKELLGRKIPLFLEFSPKKLKENGGFYLLYDTLRSVYSKICSTEGENKDIEYLEQVYSDNLTNNRHFDYFFY